MTFERLEEEFADELKWTKPSEQSYEDLLVKCRMNSNTVNLRLKPREKERLQQLYHEAAVKELGERGARRSQQS